MTVAVEFNSTRFPDPTGGDSREIDLNLFYEVSNRIFASYIVDQCRYQQIVLHLR